MCLLHVCLCLPQQQHMHQAQQGAGSALLQCCQQRLHAEGRGTKQVSQARHEPPCLDQLLPYIVAELWREGGL
jgi:hypothetical protein